MKRAFALMVMIASFALAGTAQAQGPPGICPAFGPNGPSVTHPNANAVVKVWQHAHPSLRFMGWDAEVQAYHPTGGRFNITYVNAQHQVHVSVVAPLYNRCDIHTSPFTTGSGDRPEFYIPGLGEISLPWSA